MILEPDEHHWRNGLTFKRTEAGIRIRSWFKFYHSDGIAKQAELHWSFTDIALIPDAEWNSIIKETSAK